MSHSFTQLLTYIVFSTKNREPHIDAEIKPHVYAYMGGIVKKELGGIPLAINGTTDHIHLLLRLPPTVALADTLRTIKANSSRWVHERWTSRAAFKWQTGYGAFSVSQSNTASVSRYIARQEEHHRSASFQHEMISFLRKHGIDYDERHLWD